MKHTISTITALNKLSDNKHHPRDIQNKNKEIFDKSYFGRILKYRNLLNINYVSFTDLCFNPKRKHQRLLVLTTG